MAAHTYLCRDQAGRVIYVGATRHLFRRLDAHKSTWWSPQVASVKAVVHPTITNAYAHEQRLIRELDPRWNVKGRWANRARWAAEDYIDYRKALVSLGRMTDWRRKHVATVDRMIASLRDVRGAA